MRPDWDSYFLDIAAMVSRRGTCRVKVGAVATRNNRVLLTGYAGSVPGEPHCIDVGCDWYYTSPYETDQFMASVTRHCKRTIHAEQNILAIAAAEGISLKGATWYVVPFGPCDVCSKFLVTTGAQRVVYPQPPAGFEHYGSSPILLRSPIQMYVAMGWESPVV